MAVLMTIKGLMVDPVTNNPIVVLHDEQGERVLPIWVGTFEANAIALQLENVAPPRPMTHDLLRQIITELKAIVVRVTVTEVKDATFFAVIELAVNGERVLVDSRPSDGIALALRAKAPIYVEEIVLEQARSQESDENRPDTDRLQRWLESIDPDELGKYKM
ncbi:MAG: bifunctional nuclease family protein [Gemmatimonadaceae bacterium]|jgi:bifunctional DNase/RNase|nr:bifunctional nuclease family protein [Acidobacteriota bacterium]MBP9105969.1 bifunctional nuclease family protein [Gemmatimonadaceae bacterium]